MHGQGDPNTQQHHQVSGQCVQGKSWYTIENQPTGHTHPAQGETIIIEWRYSEEELNNASDAQNPEHNLCNTPKDSRAPLDHDFGNCADCAQVGTIEDEPHQQDEQQQNWPYQYS